MNSQNNTCDNSKKMDYSFVDFIRIFLRYRKLLYIILVIGCVFFLSVFIYQKINQTKDKLNVVYSLSINELPSKISNKVMNSNTVFDLVMYQLQKKQFIAQEMKLNNVFSLKDVNEMAINKEIVSLLKSSRFKIDKPLVKNEIDISMIIKSDKYEVANAFVKSISIHIDSIFKKTIFVEIEKLKYATDKSIKEIKSESSSSIDMTVLYDLQDLSIFLQEFLNGDFKFVELTNEPFVYNDTITDSNFFVYCVIGCFVLYIILIFVIDSISRIKNNKDCYDIISKAWKDGK